VPVSPFSARLVLAGFVTVAAGIAINILALQDSAGTNSTAKDRPARTRLASDAEMLARLALEASGLGSQAAAPAPDRRDSWSGGAPATQGSRQRVGSFAPSAGRLSLVALPNADLAEAHRATIRGVQGELQRRGYEPGPADGTPGLVTRAAVMAYEFDQGLPITAEPSPEVLAHLRHGTAAPGAAIGLDAEAGQRAPVNHAATVIRSVQQSLKGLGYLASEPDGEMREDTQRSIREYEMDVGMVPSGRISGPLVSRLGRTAGRAGAASPR
jgi:peptidoglycan hydrolase-like protein with peptidoglycan-binding domain